MLVGTYRKGGKDAEKAKERRRRVKHNAGEIAKYLDSYERIHRSAAGSEVPCGKESKGMRQYVPPISESGFNRIDDAGNEVARFWLEEEILPKMRRKKFPHYYACGLVAGWITQKSTDDETDHGILKRWKAEDSQGSGGALAVFEAACEWAAKELPAHIELDVSVTGGRQATSLKQAARQDVRERNKRQYADSHHRRYNQLLDLGEEYPDASREALKAIWSTRYQMSVPTIRDSIRFVEKLEWPDGTLVEKYLRWQSPQEDPGKAC